MKRTHKVLSLNSQVIKDCVSNMEWHELVALNCKIHRSKKQKVNNDIILWKQKLIEMTPLIRWDLQKISRFEIYCGSIETSTNMNHHIYVEIGHKPAFIDEKYYHGICPKEAIPRFQFRISFNTQGIIDIFKHMDTKPPGDPIYNRGYKLPDNIDIFNTEISKFIDYVKTEFVKKYYFPGDPTNDHTNANLTDKTLGPIYKIDEHI